MFFGKIIRCAYSFELNILLVLLISSIFVPNSILNSSCGLECLLCFPYKKHECLFGICYDLNDLLSDDQQSEFM